MVYIYFKGNVRDKCPLKVVWYSCRYVRPPQNIQFPPLPRECSHIT